MNIRSLIVAIALILSLQMLKPESDRPRGVQILRLTDVVSLGLEEGKETAVTTY